MDANKNIGKMKIRNILLLIISVILALPVTAQENEHPNVIFIHVDQMNWQAVSAYGNKYVKTPAIDKMAEEGYSFRSHYSANPVCCPARSSWYTGRMSSEHGVATNSYKLLPDLPDLGSWLRRNGNYETVYAGKWHVPGRDRSDGFKVISSYAEGKGEMFDAQTARACMGFLENYNGDKPFFLNAGFVNPHDCCFTSGAQGGEGKFAFASQIEDELPPVPSNFWTYTPKTGDVEADKEREDYHKYYIYMYYKWTEMVDAEIGRLYDALMSSKFKDNTVVVFSSDHGDGLGFHGWSSKSKMEDEAWRVPLIIVPPGKMKNKVDDWEHLSIGVDVTATICDYANVPLLPKMTVGKSLRPIVEGKDVNDWHTYIVGESWSGHGGGKVGIRDKQYKSIIYTDGKLKIYDMINDPLETIDLSKSKIGKDVLERHKNYLKEYLNKITLCPPGKKDPKKSYKIYADFYNKVKTEW